MNQALALTRKELKVYFGSPMAAIFIGVFLLAALFSFFWLETFFSRNIADLRPLFQWMPLLLVFLTAALTMRQWSDEQKMGTMETLFTLPVPVASLVAGKFCAVLAMVAISLALTFCLPITVAILGDLDPGPVAGGYAGTLLMACAYISIGLFVSSRTDNQIVALLVSVLLGGIFYLAGSDTIAGLLGGVGSIVSLFGTGSHFNGIERGIVDIRDLAYYLSLAAFFFLATVLSLESKRWSTGATGGKKRRQALIVLLLVGANLLALNIWLHRINQLRLDLTEQQEFSLSQATTEILTGLDEPLLLRGYFGDKTHPLLAPLIPGIKDLMTEYQTAAPDTVQVEFVDPRQDPAMEEEANRLYGIKPVPFQVASRYEAGIINSYFHLLVKYGDQFQVLSYQDLIEISRRGDGGLAVGLRNLEYDLSRAIKKTAYGFQSMGTVFARRSQPLDLVLVVSQKTLPREVAELPAAITQAVAGLQQVAAGKLRFRTIDPDAPDSGMDRTKTNKAYGITPMTVSLFDNRTFYLHLLVRDDKNIDQVFLKGEMSQAEIRQEIESVIKRRSSGFLKNIGLVLPTEAPNPMNPSMPASSYRIMQQFLEENFNVRQVDLSEGRVDTDIDALVLVAPGALDDLALFAVDQYLMRGGAVLAIAGRYALDLTPYSKGFQVKKNGKELFDLLSHYGVMVEDAMVMDQVNEPLPIPVTRDLGGFTVQEIRRLSYPFFIDVRPEQMEKGSPITRSLPAVTLHWASPVSTVPADAVKDKVEVKRLLSSSPRSWTTTDTTIQPDFTIFPDTGFAPGKEMEPRLLAVSLRGPLTSFYAGKKDPRPEHRKKPADTADRKKDEPEQDQPLLPREPILAQAPDNARLLVIGASEFLHDTVIAMSRTAGSDRFMNGLALLQNGVDWAVEDEELLSIRSRGAHTRLLIPMSQEAQSMWEWFNYLFVLIALVCTAWFGIRQQRREKPLVSTLAIDAPEKEMQP